MKLDKIGREKIIKYLGIFDLYEELDVNGIKIVLVHGGLLNFDENKDLDEYDNYDIIWGRYDYTKQYYRDKYLVTGHTPTYHINPNYKGRIFKKNNHITIDCGVAQGGRLGCICLNTFEEFHI